MRLLFWYPKGRVAYGCLNETFSFFTDKTIFLPRRPFPAVHRDTVKLKMCQRCKTQFDGCWKSSKRTHEASRGDQTKPSFLYNKMRSWSESWDLESLETCQGDLLSCIEKTVDKESVVSQEGLLSMLCGCGEWEQRGMVCSLSSWYNLCVCVLPRTKAGELADR